MSKKEKKQMYQEEDERLDKFINGKQKKWESLKTDSLPECWLNEILSL